VRAAVASSSVAPPPSTEPWVKDLSQKGRVLQVASLPESVLHDREKGLKLQRLAALRAEAERHITAEEQLHAIRAQAYADLQKQAAELREQAAVRENRIYKQYLHQTRSQQEAFRKAEDQLTHILREQGGQVHNNFGALERADAGAVGRGRRFKVDWSHAPRVVRLRFDLLRAVKNKLPRGRYVVMATLYDRLGGHPLRWSRLDTALDDVDQREKEVASAEGEEDNLLAGGLKRADASGHLRPRWTGCTPFPRRHGGKFSSLELSFAQKQNRVFLVLPSQKEARPSMCVVFELIQVGAGTARRRLCVSYAGTARPSRQCRGRRSKTDRVVGWGAFPAFSATKDWDAIQGKFRVPLLRGELDGTVDKFERIEQRSACCASLRAVVVVTVAITDVCAVAENLDTWLCNMYFDVRHLPRYMEVRPACTRSAPLCCAVLCCAVLCCVADLKPVLLACSPRAQGMKEYEVEVAFSSKLLHLASRDDENGAQSDSDESGDEDAEKAPAPFRVEVHSDDRKEKAQTALLLSTAMPMGCVTGRASARVR
jgi:hypothetical protein